MQNLLPETQTSTCPRQTLDQAAPSSYRVRSVACAHGLRMRLAAMGLRTGDLLELLFRNRTGAVVRVGDTRLALGNELLKAIEVEPA